MPETNLKHEKMIRIAIYAICQTLLETGIDYNAIEEIGGETLEAFATEKLEAELAAIEAEKLTQIHGAESQQQEDNRNNADFTRRNCY